MNQEELKQRLTKLTDEWDKQDEIDHLFDYFIANGVTIRERGEWIWDAGYFNCGFCHTKTMRPFDFCPHCGADLRGKNDE